MHRVGSHENVKGKAIGIMAARPMPRHNPLVNSAAADKWAQSTECLQNGTKTASTGSCGLDLKLDAEPEKSEFLFFRRTKTRSGPDMGPLRDCTTPLEPLQWACMKFWQFSLLKSPHKCFD